MRGSACKATELNYPMKGDREKNILMSLAFLKEISSCRDSLSKFSAKIRDLVMIDPDNFQDALKILNAEKLSLESTLSASLDELKHLNQQRSEICDKIDGDLFQKNFRIFFTAFDQLSNCDKKMLLKALVPKIVIHSDFRVELMVNPVFYDDLANGRHESGLKVRVEKNWRERRDSNPRPSA